MEEKVKIKTKKAKLSTDVKTTTVKKEECFFSLYSSELLNIKTEFACPKVNTSVTIVRLTSIIPKRPKSAALK